MKLNTSLDKTHISAQHSSKSHLEESKSSRLSSHTANDTYLKDRHYFKMDDEPIFDAILLNMVLGHAVNIKKKARIKIRDSCVLIGVIDESGLLEENEVHIRVESRSFENDKEIEKAVEELDANMAKQDKKKKGFFADLMQTTDFEPKTVTGRVMVTKNPCSHPGDIRILNAIDASTDPRFEGKEDW